MNYTNDMYLHSSSGYCMPFEETDKDVKLLLGYGKQIHPKTKQEFYHHGIDLHAPHYLLSAVATGIVIGIGTDSTHGMFLTIRYGVYYVTYAHISNVFVNFGQRVSAGQTVATSGNFLHLGVSINDEEISPLDFLTMLYGNVKSQRATDKDGNPEILTLGDGDFRTSWDNDQDEIEKLLLRFFPMYMGDISRGNYDVPEHTRHSLEGIFRLGNERHIFFETLPSQANPLGMGNRSLSFAEKIQNILIGDFLNYLALCHRVFLSTMSDENKKKLMTGL